MTDEPQDVIRITTEDVNSPDVDDVLARQQWAMGAFPGPDGSQEWQRVEASRGSPLYSTMLYTALAGAVGGFVGWIVLEPFYGETQGGGPLWLLVLPTVGAGIGLFIGLIEGAVSRNLGRATLCGSVGWAVAFVAGFPSTLIAQVIYVVLRVTGDAVAGPWEEMGRPAAGALLGASVARALAWAVAGTTVGLGQGIALRSGKLVLNGLLGGIMGGFLGGLVFNPIALALGGGNVQVVQEAAASRGIGFSLIGLAAGLMIGLVGELAKDAWLRVLTGSLAGKQFVMYRNPTYLGSSPKCEIYLFKDPAVEPQHAAIHQAGPAYEIEDLRSASGTYVNGRAVVGRVRLADGDQIQIGDTVFDYSERRRQRGSQ